MVLSEEWWTSGMVFNDRLVCQFHKSGFTNGIFYGENSFYNPTSIVLFEMFFIFVFSRTIYFLFQPMRQSMIVAQIVAGFIMGPSMLTHYRVLANKLFPPPGSYVLKTISSFGFMLHLFVMGVKIDMNVIRSAGAKSLVVGLSGLIFSLSFGAFTFYEVRQHTQLDQNLFTGIRMLITFNSLTFFMVTSGNINDLKLSNSELGRLACSSSLAVDLLGLLGVIVSLTWFGNVDTSSDIMTPRLISFFSISFYYAVLFCIFRPLVLYVVSKTPDGATTMKQTHLLIVLVILMLAWFWGEVVGQRFATFLFGLSLPDGPPLGSTLVHKLDLFTSGILLPIFCTIAGWRTNFSSWKGNPQVWGVEFVFVIGHLAKLFGIVLSSTVIGMSFHDALSLSLMMSFKGIIEIATLNAWSDRGLLDDRLFSLSMLNIVLFTGVAFPLVQYLYDPSKQYTSIKQGNNTRIQGKNNLQILVCIYNEDSVASIVNLVKLVNNTGDTISLFTLQLIHLTGSSMSILEPLNNCKRMGNHYEHVVKAFDQLEAESQGLIKIQHLVSVTPYESMHNDICTIAHDTRTNIIITPFYIKRGTNENVDRIKEVNKRVILKAPCSVAILIDKRCGAIIRDECIYQIAMLFIGGSDDHEALALARRMTEHQSVRLTVIWLRLKDVQPPLEDVRVMTDFHIKAKKNDRIGFREHYIIDDIETKNVVISMQHVHLFIVGKYHEPGCPVIQGMTDLNENPEIGALGDMLATSNFRFSILVVQRQPSLNWNIDSSINQRVDKFFSFDEFHKSKSSTLCCSLGV
ncbi:hypothetical protein RND81_05G274000 [Saponaria officinalis]|uniref:Cation/H+ exchanger domain-containing protein n=1 Tax=Saponaria officinalis TaxID=3572 RepID=A0AAW1L397_SAPOF